MKFFRKRTSIPDAIVKRLKNGDIAIKSGDTLFRFNPADYTAITYGGTSAGAHALLGSHTVHGDKVELATLPSLEHAARAHKAVCAAYAGTSTGGWWKWPAGVVAGFVALNVLVSAPTAAVATVAAPATGAPHFGLAAAQVGVGGQFNPNEPSLDDLAAGNYQPNIKVRVPEVKAPELSCANGVK